MLYLPKPVVLVGFACVELKPAHHPSRRSHFAQALQRGRAIWRRSKVRSDRVNYCMLRALDSTGACYAGIAKMATGVPILLLRTVIAIIFFAVVIQMDLPAGIYRTGLPQAVIVVVGR